MYKCWHHNKCIHVQVNNTWNKASFKLTVLTIMYLQTVNPTSYYHLNTAETVLLLRYASQSHSSQRGCRWATGKEDHDVGSHHTTLKREQKNTCRTIWLLLCLLQTIVCCSPWAPLPVKHLHRVYKYMHWFITFVVC